MIEARNLSIGYGSKVVYSNLDFTVEKGSCVLLEGRNGSGKSTLLRTIAGMQKPVSGTLKCGKVSMVPSRVPKVKGFTTKQFIGLSDGSPDNIAQAMEMLGIESLASRDISTLSDGEFQKACIAAALSRQSEVLLLDEPTAFLDAESRISVLSLLKDISRKGIAVLFSSHDLYDARAICDKSIRL